MVQGFFGGFVWGPRDFFWFWFLLPFDHPRYSKSRVATLGNDACMRAVSLSTSPSFNPVHGFNFFYSDPVFPNNFFPNLHFQRRRLTVKVGLKPLSPRISSAGKYRLLQLDEKKKKGNRTEQLEPIDIYFQLIEHVFKEY